MRVAVLGAGGTIAPAIVRDLAESDEVEALRLLDLDGERAAAVAGAHGRGRASAAVVDARAGLADAIEMPLEVRRERLDGIRERVRTHDLDAWAERELHELDARAPVRAS